LTAVVKVLLGTFEELQKVTVSFIMSVCASIQYCVLVVCAVNKTCS
jgi:hypothetical protein